MAFTATLGGNDITEYCQRITHKPELNLRSEAEVLVPSSLVTFTEGEDFLELTEGTVKHRGRAYYGEDNGDPDAAFRVIRSYDGMVWWDRMQVMDADGDYSDPHIIEDNLNAVDIMGAAIDNWNAQNAVDGPGDLTVGTKAGGGTTLVGFKPVDWPWSLDRLREFLVNTGQLDVVVNQGADTVDLYNGDFGSDLSGSVAFQYGMGAFNCTNAKYSFDFTNTVSRIRYFLGPKRPQYPTDVQHWAGDVQIDDSDLDNPPFDTLEPTIEALSANIEATMMLLRRIEIYDANGDENKLRTLYMHIWQSDAMINMRPRRLLTLTPEPGISPSFVCGDKITVGAVMGETHSSVQRVYSYQADQDPEGNIQISSITTSADQG